MAGRQPPLEPPLEPPPLSRDDDSESELLRLLSRVALSQQQPPPQIQHHHHHKTAQAASDAGQPQSDLDAPGSLAHDVHAHTTTTQPCHVQPVTTLSQPAHEPPPTPSAFPPAVAPPKDPLAHPAQPPPLAPRTPGAWLFSAKSEVDWRDSSHSSSPPAPPTPPLVGPSPPATPATSHWGANTFVCALCHASLSDETLSAASHMCNELWQYTAEFSNSGAEAGLLLAGVEHISKAQELTIMTGSGSARKVGLSTLVGKEVDALFMLSSESERARVLRYLASCGVRTIPLGHTSEWRCIHAQLEPNSSSLPFGRAELRLKDHAQTSPGAASSPASAHAPVIVAPSHADVAPWLADTHWTSTTSIDSRGSSSASTGARKSQPGAADWRCPSCANINFAFRRVCNRCGLPRPGGLQAPTVTLERQTCPYTVMLMRVPVAATEADVHESMHQFGSVLAGGLKFHHQGGGKHRRGSQAEGVSLHVFCRFVQPAAAAAALRCGEVRILGQAVHLNPAFLRGNCASTTSSEPPAPSPIAQSSYSSSAPAQPLKTPYPTVSSTPTRRPSASDYGVELGVAALGVIGFLAVLFQLLSGCEPLCARIRQLQGSGDAILSSCQQLLSSFLHANSRSIQPQSLVLATLSSRFIDQLGQRVVRRDASHMFEAAVEALCESRDGRLVTALQDQFLLRVMHRCECDCGELFETAPCSQYAFYVAASALLQNKEATPSSLMSFGLGPTCPRTTCNRQMHTSRFVVPPLPKVLVVAIAWSGATALANSASVVQRVERAFYLDRVMGGLPSTTPLVLTGLICLYDDDKHVGFLPYHAGWRVFDDASAAHHCSDNFDHLIRSCSAAKLRPAYLLYTFTKS